MQRSCLGEPGAEEGSECVLRGGGHTTAINIEDVQVVARHTAARHREDNDIPLLYSICNALRLVSVAKERSLSSLMFPPRPTTSNGFCGYLSLFISSKLSRSSAPAPHCSPRSPTRADPPGVSAGVLASRGVTAALHLVD
jgi:hypothetical protein